MKYRIANLALFLVLPLLFFSLMTDFSRLFDVGSSFPVLKEVPSAITLAPSPALSLSARSAVLITSGGHVVYGKNEHTRAEMASTTKVMTGLLAAEYLEKNGTEQTVTVSKSVTNIEGSSIYLEEGEKVLLLDLLYAVMLASANDAAVALAEAVGGTVDRFVDMMNEKSASLGLEDTHFENPHGLSAENHYTTAYSLALLMAKAMENPLFARVTATGRYTMKSEGATRHLVNHNRLLSSYDGITGGKTGFTRRAGRCLVTAAEQNGAKFYAVTLSAPDDWNDHKTLFDYAFSHWEAVTLPAESYTLPVVAGKDATATIRAEAVTLTLPKERKELLIAREAPRFLYAPIAKGDPVGKITVTLSGEVVATLPLENENTVEEEKKKNFFDRLFSWINKG